MYTTLAHPIRLFPCCLFHALYSIFLSAIFRLSNTIYILTHAHSRKTHWYSLSLSLLLLFLFMSLLSYHYFFLTRFSLQIYIKYKLMKTGKIVKQLYNVVKCVFSIQRFISRYSRKYISMNHRHFFFCAFLASQCPLFQLLITNVSGHT